MTKQLLRHSWSELLWVFMTSLSLCYCYTTKIIISQITQHSQHESDTLPTHSEVVLTPHKECLCSTFLTLPWCTDSLISLPGCSINIIRCETNCTENLHSWVFICNLSILNCIRDMCIDRRGYYNLEPNRRSFATMKYLTTYYTHTSPDIHTIRNSAVFAGSSSGLICIL